MGPGPSSTQSSHRPDRRQERGDLFPFRGWSDRSTCNAGRGHGRPARGRDRHDGRRRRGTCGLRGNHNDPNCLRNWRRSGHIRPSHEPQSAGPQCNRSVHLSAGAGGKTTGAPPRAGSGCRVDRGVAQRNQCEFSNSVEGCSGCRSRPRATSEHPERKYRT